MSAMPRVVPRAARPAAACRHCGQAVAHAASCPERGMTEVVDAADPDSPNRTIRRLRRVDPLHALALRDRDWAAALRLRDDADLAEGVREDMGASGLAHWQRSHFSAVQLDAVRSLAGAMCALGPICAPVVAAVVLRWLSASASAAELGLDRETVGRRLRLGLERLSDYYG